MISILDTLDFIKGVHPKAGRAVAAILLLLVLYVAPVRSWFMAHEEACVRSAMQPAFRALAAQSSRPLPTPSFPARR